jgi:hypothetical protein
MTIIASAGSATAIALAADTLVTDGAGNTWVDRKLFILDGRLCVASWGAGPDGVPATMDAVQVGTRNARGVAEHLASVFDGVTSPYEFGLFVAGVENGTPVLWHVDVPDRNPPHRGTLVTPRDPYGVWTRAWPSLAVYTATLPADPKASPDQLVRLAEDRVHHATTVAPRDVSGLHSVLLTTTGAAWRTRP